MNKPIQSKLKHLWSSKLHPFHNKLPRFLELELRWWHDDLHFSAACIPTSTRSLIGRTTATLFERSQESARILCEGKSLTYIDAQLLTAQMGVVVLEVLGKTWEGGTWWWNRTIAFFYMHIFIIKHIFLSYLPLSFLFPSCASMVT